MAKKRRRRARSKKTTPAKKRTTRRKKRRAVASPVKRRRSSRRRRAANPARRARRVRRAAARRPSVRRRSSRRRRNPGGPIGEAVIALLAGGAAFAAVHAGAYYVTKDMAQNGQRNQKIIAGLLAAGGLYLAVKKHKPLLGAALGTGGLLAGFGTSIVLGMMRFLPAKPASSTSAVYAENMQAVYAENMRGLAPAMGDYDQVIGDPIPAAPWENPTPFG